MTISRPGEADLHEKDCARGAAPTWIATAHRCVYASLAVWELRSGDYGALIEFGPDGIPILTRGLGSLGVARETENPLNFGKDFASLWRDLLQQPREALGRLPQDARTDADDLMSMIASNPQKIEKALDPEADLYPQEITHAPLHPLHAGAKRQQSERPACAAGRRMARRRRARFTGFIITPPREGAGT